jgi:DNA-binding winged helix-turn-helix (wHTH) protein
VFEFNTQARELTKDGVRLKVQEQPMQILAALLEQAGQIVPREDLQRRLWPDGTFVEYEQSLNKAVNKLRDALGDSAVRPIYIETLARRGYRFVAPVEGDRTVQPVATTPVPRGRVVPWMAAGGLVLAMALGTGYWPIDVPQVERVVQLSNDTTLKTAFGRMVSDGNRVLYGDGDDVWSVPASGGEPRKLLLPFLHGVKILADYSPIRQLILLASPYTGKSGANELWLAGTEGEAPHKIGEVQPPIKCALSPDGERVAQCTPDGIYIQSIANGTRTKIHPMKAMSPGQPWWHPSGDRVGFLDSPDDPRKVRAWQVNDDVHTCGELCRRRSRDKERARGPRTARDSSTWAARERFFFGFRPVFWGG